VPAHRALLEAFARDSSGRSFFALPLRVRGRLVAALLLEPRDEEFSEEQLAEFRRIAAKAAIAFELCIMRAKLKKA
jgi:GAF domain-containing protein